MPAVSYLDLAASWEPTKQLQVRGGISNVMDRDPPLVSSELISGGAPNYYEFYDGLGRQVFLALTAKF
jgi:outer membrane receptor protein involved in Fe transport